MKKFIVWLLLALVVLTPILGMNACNRPEQTVDPDQPVEQDDPKDPDGKDDPSDVAGVPSEREVTVVKGVPFTNIRPSWVVFPRGLPRRSTSQQ
jgi:hypothetical protein